jgi:cytochrome c peroxidase
LLALLLALPVALRAADSAYDAAVAQTDREDPAVAGVPAPRRVPRWMDADASGRLIADGTYANERGDVGVVMAGGTVAEVRDQAFFRALGTNGRACVTCHQPQDGMSLSVDTVRWMWRATRGADPLFAPVDGTNCPHLPAAAPASHSLLLNRGLIRVFLPWPPRDARGRPLSPDFTLEVVRDPTGCNTHPQYGLGAASPTVSVYRRPRPAANLALAQRAGLMADGRAASLEAQAADAASGHLEAPAPLAAAQVDAIVAFESQVYVAQVFDNRAGRLVGGAPATFGPRALEAAAAAAPGIPRRSDVFPLDATWRTPAATATMTAARASIGRGHDLFFTRRFRRDDGKATCASCHGATAAGLPASTRGNAAELRRPVFAARESGAHDAALPLFKVTCRSRRVLFTEDPGRALITGRCRDVGVLAAQQLRGLASRPPYFTNGSAATLRDVVDFYDRRFRIGLTDAEKDDLANFLAAL